MLVICLFICLFIFVYILFLYLLIHGPDRLEWKSFSRFFNSTMFRVEGISQYSNLHLMRGKSSITGITRIIYEWIYGITWEHVYFSISGHFIVDTNYFHFKASIVSLLFVCFLIVTWVAVLFPLFLFLLVYLRYHVYHHCYFHY